MSAPVNTRSQVKALAWEEARVGGMIAGAFLIVGILLILLGWYPPNESDPWERNEFLLQFATLGVPILAALLLILNPDTSGHLVGGFSKRILRLPVQTHVAVAVALVARTVFVFAGSAALLGLASVLLGDAPGLAAVALITILYVVAQLVDWLRGPVSGLASLIVLGAIAILLYSVMPEALVFAPFGWCLSFAGAIIEWGLSVSERSSLILPGIVVAVTLLAYGISAVAVHADRIGRRYGVPEIWEWPKRVSFFDRAHAKPFRSPMAAQVWFELRRSKWSLPLSAALSYVVVMGVAWVNWRGEDAIYGASYFGLFACVPLGACVHGIFTRIVGLRKRSTSSNYEYLQPFDDIQFVSARIRAGLIVLIPTLLAALVIHFAFAGSYLVVDLIPDALQRGITSPREIIWIFLGRGLVVFLFAWPLLAIGTRLFRRMLAILFGVTVVALIMDVLLDTDFLDVDSGPISLVLMVALALLAVVMFVMAIRSGILPPGLAMKWFLAWALLAWLFHYALVTVWSPEPIASREHFASIVTAVVCSALLPLMCLALLFDLHRRRRGSTVLLDRNKQRSADSTPRPARVLTGVAMTALVAAIVWLGWPATPAYIEFRKSQGLPVTLSELNAWYVEPPAGENAAPEYLRLSRKREALRIAVEKKRANEVKNSYERLEFDRKNLFVVGGLELPLSGPLSRAPWEATERYWQEVTSNVAPELKTLASRDTRKSRFPLDFTSGDAYYSYYISNHPGRVYALEVELQLDALHWAVAGRSSDATDSVLAILALVDSLSNEPTIWTQRDRLRLLGRAARTVETMLNRSAPAAVDLERLQRAFAESLSIEEEFKSVERGILGDSTIRLSPTGPYSIQASTRLRHPFSLVEYLSFPAAAVRMLMVLEPERANEQLRQPWSQVSNRYDERTFEEYSGLEFLFPVISGHLGDYLWFGESVRLACMELGFAQVALGIERYRLANQTLPQSLAELVPAYLSKIPDDPFAASARVPLRYLVRDSGEYLVYSVGYDMDDDLGGTNLKDYRDRDIAFTIAPMSIRTGPQVAAQ